MTGFTPLQLRVLDALGHEVLRLRKGDAGADAPAGAGPASGLADAPGGVPDVLRFHDGGAAPSPRDRLLAAILAAIGRSPRALRPEGDAVALDLGAGDAVLEVDLAELRRSPPAKAALWRRIRPLAAGRGD